MKLKIFLEAHQKFTTKESLSDNIGDGYLLEHNLMFRNIRKAAKARNVRFSSERFHDYDVLPLTQLPKILQSQTVPYLPNVHALMEIEKTVPGKFGIDDTPPLRANYVHHESAHCLARLLRMEFLGDVKERSPEGQKELTLMIMFEEAFANASESMLSAFSEPGMHDHFLLRNTYIFEEPATRKNIKAAIKLIGLGNVFKWIVFSFLFANFQRTKASAAELKRVLALVLKEKDGLHSRLTDRELHLLKEVFQSGFDLDPQFTIRTNEFCLTMMGISASSKVLFAWDFLKKFETDSSYATCLEAMGKVAEGS